MKNICFQMTRKGWFLAFVMLCLAFPAFAQKSAVTGTVVDPEGEPLIGASVLAEGTSEGVATDFDGNFSINVAPNAVLVVSYVGYDTQRVSVDGRKHIDITLKENSVMLNEVVAIGYGVVKKSDATGSVAVVKPDEIEAGLATSAQDMLVGATPGVVVTTNGSPSEGGTIRIRGGASLNANNDPLIVIDGVPMERGNVKGSANPLALISPDNIESMTVLKDASSTAIFGSRASNGVIIITTKKGQSGKPQVNFSANMHIAHARTTLDMMSAAQYRRFVTELNGAESGVLTSLGDADTDWQDEILRTSVSHDYALSVGGTVGILPYRVSVSYTKNNGIITNTGMDRLTAGLNLSPKFFNDLLSVNASIKGAYIKNEYTNVGELAGAAAMNPTIPVRGENVFNNWTTYIAGGALAGATTPGNAINTLAALNPVSRIKDFDRHADVWQSVGNLQLDLKMPFLTDLRANLNLGYEYNHGKETNFDSPFSPSAWKSGHYSPDTTDPTKDGFSTIGYDHQRRYNLLLDFYLNYNREFEEIKSSLDVTAGYSWQKFVSKTKGWGVVYAPDEYAAQYAAINNISEEDALTYMRAINGYQRDVVGRTSSPYQLVSFFGRVNYGFMGKYLLTVTVRCDGSSRFSKDHRWGTFPSVALAWRMIDENFMEDTRGWLSDLKIRGTWGVTGQQDLFLSFPYLPVYNVSTNQNQAWIGPDGKPVYVVTPQSYNADLKWEETTTWNAGIDFGFFNNRINGSIDFYKRKTKDLLTWANYPAGSNLSNEGNLNLGDMENTGIEFNIITRPVVTTDFSWTSSLNVAWNKNKITRMAEGATGAAGSIGNGNNVQLNSVGHAAFSFYVYEQVYNPDGTPMEGVFVDRDGDGAITDADKYIFHSRDPKVTLNWQNSFTYKNWDLSFALRASLGNWMYNQNMSSASFANPSAMIAPLGNLMNDTYIFKQSRTTTMLLSDYFVQNASFLRCDNITLGYTWDNLLNNALRLRLFGAVQNPFVITKYKGLDPEKFEGIDNDVYPKPTTYSIGLIATF